MDFNCQSVVNPLLDIAKFLPHTVYPENYGGYEDQKEIDLYQKLLRETDATKQRALIREFEKVTGVPVLLNTSFNENEPIVDTPAQALFCFLRTRMDALVLGNTILIRQTQATEIAPALMKSAF